MEAVVIAALINAAALVTVACINARMALKQNRTKRKERPRRNGKRS